MNTSQPPTQISSPSSASPQVGRLAANAAAACAIGIHLYLLKTHYELHYGESAERLLCDMSSTFSCSAASASAYSEFLKVPMALWGILANVAFIILTAWEAAAAPKAKNGHRTSLLCLSVVVVTASIAMGLISVFALNTICPFCLATYALSAITAYGAWRSYRPGWTFAIHPPNLIFGVVVFASGFVINDMARSSYVGPNGDAMATAAVSEWKQNPVLEISETDPLAIGPERAKAKLILAEFADFRCIHCKMATQPIKAFLSSHPDTRLEFYSWPLDGECNTSISQTNGASCLLARIVWCARKTNQKGWEAHTQIFERFEEWRTVESVKAAIPSIANQLGIEPGILETCSDSAEAKAIITKQAQLGTSLNLRGTPTIFANGRLLPAGNTLPVLTNAHRSLQ